MRLRAPKQAGFSLLELLIQLAVFGLIVAFGVPSIMQWSATVRLQSAAQEIASALHEARLHAIRHGRNTALRFHYDAEHERMYWDLYADADGDGVRTRDIEEGVDRPVRGFHGFAQFSDIRPGFPPGPPPRHPGNPSRRLGRLQDPIRFNRSDMASFSPHGTATPGSVYLTDGKALLAAVRTDHRTGRIRIVSYDAKKEEWR